MECDQVRPVGTIVVVDDDERVQRTFLRTADPSIHVVCVGDAGSALRVVQRAGRCVAVVDMRLGSSSGIELIKEIKTHRPHSTAVLMSAYTSTEMAVWAMRAGADDVVQKPVSLREIISRLNPRKEPTDFEPTTVERALWEHVQRVLGDCGGNVSMTAERLGVYRSTLRRWLQRGPARH